MKKNKTKIYVDCDFITFMIYQICDLCQQKTLNCSVFFTICSHNLANKALWQQKVCSLKEIQLSVFSFITQVFNATIKSQ